MNADVVAPSMDLAVADAVAVRVAADVAASAATDVAGGSGSDLSASIKLDPMDAAAVHSINHKAIYPN